jgi:hypothetical protein
MRSRMRCLWHQEKTPSLVRRKSDWFCYGSCNKAFTHAEVEAKLGKELEYDFQETEPEDLQETYKYIDSLPKLKVRGLEFPADDRGYFICWPSREYYKYRQFNPGKGPKYIGPSGHKPPIFWASRFKASTLLIVEGEINALSLSRACPYYDICSFGSATSFNKDTLTKHLTILNKYNKLLVILDKDAAGLKALIETKAFLLYKIPYVNYIQLEKDCNEILCDEGPEELQKTVSRYL